MKKKILLLGASGSIGKQSLEIIKKYKNMFVLSGFSVHKNKQKFEHITKEFPDSIGFISGEHKLDAFIRFIENSNADMVINGIAGSSGMLPSFVSIESGKDLALANKETIVMAGKQIKEQAKKNKQKIIPVDSEHSALFCLINAHGIQNIQELVLTASGGPFRTWKKQDLKKIKPKDALNHPTWTMGTKITIDSASLANKGLEIIEACLLFDIKPENIKVVVHPESIIHSMVRTHDGVLYAQISKPDMKHPIFTALTWPYNVKNNFELINFDSSFSLHFEPPRLDDFPMLKLAYQVVKQHSAYAIAYNAANEEAVDAFLTGKITFLAIADLTKFVLDQDLGKAPITVDEILEIDLKARTYAHKFIKGNE